MQMREKKRKKLRFLTEKCAKICIKLKLLTTSIVDISCGTNF